MNCLTEVYLVAYSNMKIYVTLGKGHGKTTLSAFDAALKDAGVYNYNLITLSSIIPQGSKVYERKFKSPKDSYGNRLYLVKSEIRSRESGKFIGAALGWYQIEDGRGVFVEHEGIGETKEAVESNLLEEVKESLSDICRFRSFPISEKKMKIKINIVKVEDSAACALLLAVYKDEGWEI